MSSDLRKKIILWLKSINPPWPYIIYLISGVFAESSTSFQSADNSGTIYNFTSFNHFQAIKISKEMNMSNWLYVWLYHS